MSFNVVNFATRPASLVLNASADRPLVFDTKENAQEFAKNLQNETGNKHGIRKAKTGDSKWRDREKLRLADGTYIPLTKWPDFDWLRANARDRKTIDEHFAHIIRGKESLIGYTESPEAGEADKQTKITCGKYLTKFFGHYLSSGDIKAYAESFASQFDEIVVQFSERTADDIERVYRYGPKSCMNEKEFVFGHPSRAYGTGDLCVAYLERQGSITARALCMPDRKTYSRIYGDVARLDAALKKDGWKPAPPVGARILKLTASIKGQPHYILPYIDAGHNSGTGHLYCKPNPADENTFLVCSAHGDWVADAGATSGIVLDRHAPPRTPCFFCDEPTAEADSFPVIIARDGGVRPCCPDCRQTGDVVEHAHRLWHRNALQWHEGQAYTPQAWARISFTCGCCGTVRHNSERFMIEGVPFMRPDQFRGYVCREIHCGPAQHDHMYREALGLNERHRPTRRDPMDELDEPVRRRA